MNYKLILTVSTIALLFTFSCKCENDKSVQSVFGINQGPFEVKYAKGFKITTTETCYLVNISDPQNLELTKYNYALVKKGEKSPDIPDGYTRIDIPLKRIICMTSLQLSNFIKVDALDKVVGITSTKHLFNNKIKDMLKEGRIKKIGIEGNFDNEIIMSLNPDLIFVSPFKRGGYDALNETGITLFVHLGYKELTPLGQAEWIKLTSLLIGEENRAFNIFSKIEQDYNQLKSLSKNAIKRPIVFSGEMRNGNWYVAGGKSYLAELIRDAGAEYFLKDDNHSGGINMDFESVYNIAAEADYWRLLVSKEGAYSYDEIKSQDNRYADFKAYKNKTILLCNLRERAFYENSPMEPQIVLADMIKAFHPHILPNHEPVYYSLLK